MKLPSDNIFYNKLCALIIVKQISDGVLIQFRLIHYYGRVLLGS